MAVNPNIALPPLGKAHINQTRWLLWHASLSLIITSTFHHILSLWSQKGQPVCIAFCSYLPLYELFLPSVSPPAPQVIPRTHPRSSLMGSRTSPTCYHITHLFVPFLLCCPCERHCWRKWPSTASITSLLMATTTTSCGIADGCSFCWPRRATTARELRSPQCSPLGPVSRGQVERRPSSLRMRCYPLPSYIKPANAWMLSAYYVDQSMVFLCFGVSRNFSRKQALTNLLDSTLCSSQGSIAGVETLW